VRNQSLASVFLCAIDGVDWLAIAAMITFT